MSSTTFSPETVQSVAEQRFDNSAVKRLKPNAAGPNTTETPSVENAVARPNQTAAAAIAVQTEVIETAVNATLNQGSLGAVTQASQILATGSLDLFRQMMASSQSAYAEALSGWRALASARTVKEQIEAQTSLVRSSTTWVITEGGRFTKASLDLAEKASSPLIARASRAAEMFQIPKVWRHAAGPKGPVILMRHGAANPRRDWPRWVSLETGEGDVPTTAAFVEYVNANLREEIPSWDPNMETSGAVALSPAASLSLWAHDIAAKVALRNNAFAVSHE